jgi:Transposase DDE domain
VPFKANQDRRHHIPKQRHRVTNWAAYDIALRQRGSLTVWFTEAAIAAWKAALRATRGGQPRYSALAITTAGLRRLLARRADTASASADGLLLFSNGPPSRTRIEVRIPFPPSMRLLLRESLLFALKSPARIGAANFYI